MNNMGARKFIDPETLIIIYALYDPRNIEDIKYIGWTSKTDINKRLKEHIKDAKLNFPEDYE